MPSGLSIAPPHGRHHEWKPYARPVASGGGSKQHYSASASAAARRRDEYRDVLTEDLPPLPPSLSEILATFQKYGNGDRKLLLTILRAKQAEEDRLADIIQSRLAALKDRARYMASLSPPLSAVHTPHTTISVSGSGTARSTPSPRLPGIHAALAQRQADEAHDRRMARVDLPPPATWAPTPISTDVRRSPPAPAKERLSIGSASSRASAVSDLIDGRSPGAMTRRSLSDEGWESKSAVSPKAPGLEMLLNAVRADGQ